MKVLLAGATGAIGRPLLRVLPEAGHDAVAVGAVAVGNGEPVVGDVPLVGAGDLDVLAVL